MSISCRKDVCTRTSLVHIEQANRTKQQTKTQKKTPTTTTRKSPSQTCVSPEETAKQTTANQTQQKRGRSPNRTPTKSICQGTIIEQNGDGLLEDSHMPVGWPLHIDGAVRQCCIHRSATLQELDDMLAEYDMKRDSVEINHRAPQWSHNAVWNRKYMELKPGYTLRQLWADSELLGTNHPRLMK